MLDELLGYKEQKASLHNRDKKAQRIMIMISSLELGENKDWTFSRHVMKEMLEAMADLPGFFYTVLLSEAVFMARRSSSFLGALVKLAEKGEVIVHSESWKHYFPEEEPFIGTLRSSEYIASRMIIADKVVTLS